VVTHDVDTAAGRDFCGRLMDVNDSFGIRSSFQIVPEGRYQVADSFPRLIRQRGHEVNVHDLNHDGYLFSSREMFLGRVGRVNEHGSRFGARGFRSGVLYRNQEWFDALEFEYDMSVPNVAHLDPQQGGCCTVMPYFIGRILELPLTTTQDYSLFHILRSYSIDLWKRQIALILEKHGLISFNVHPDYLAERKAQATYRELLGYLGQLRENENVWMTLPGEISVWWRARDRMRLVEGPDGWRIEGAEATRARLAWATLIDDRLVYEL
jgi:hypothetical protein